MILRKPCPLSTRFTLSCGFASSHSLDVALVEVRRRFFVAPPVLPIDPTGDAQRLNASGHLAGQRVVTQIQPGEIAQIRTPGEQARSPVGDAAVPQVESFEALED